MRLSKYIAGAGVASRRQAEEIIAQGRVKVNGALIIEPAYQVQPGIDEVECDETKLVFESPVYLLLYKPVGYLSSVGDARGRPTVMDLVADISARVYPVGRLDLDTEGLLLMSNDGEFANLMMHPRYEMSKRYEALVKGKVKKQALYKLERGLELEDGITAPARVRILAASQDNTLLELEIHEGRKRQVKRMCAAVGHPVIKLKRTSLAFLTLDGVECGKYRLLNGEEVEKLKALARRKSGESLR
ncbi:pseudouridine synthase [Syntrophomonas palmitatica]|uniref:pseudouridine synthase n=1 Tax=Syntrophomonas palmitatica TaxID=402877 RepID=UPI00241F77B8|nr:pseudouridine synthase [Syntrophomonas palmitatica]